MLDEIERANSAKHGYGARSFAHSLRECFERLTERDVAPDDLTRLAAVSERILSQPKELIAGVEETLRYLAPQHELVLFTKGHHEEQRLKIDQSGLAPFFDRAAVVAEKDLAAYRQLIAEANLDPRRTWMVGNSPRSDVNPALAAGLNAGYVPHAQTWSLEREAVAEAPRRSRSCGSISRSAVESGCASDRHRPPRGAGAPMPPQPFSG